MTDGHAAQYLLYPCLAFLLGHTQISKRQLYILFNIQFINQVKTLEHKTNLALANLGTLTLLERAHILTIQQILTTGRIIEQTQNVK